MQITGLKSKPTVLVLVPIEADPETRIQLQEVDLVGSPKHSSRGEWGGETGKERQPIKDAPLHQLPLWATGA